MSIYVVYLRCSTREQGLMGLGISAQRNAVLEFANHTGGSIIAEYSEIVSGAEDNRSELVNALQKCKEHNAILLISKIDRLTRRLKHIAILRESNVRFIAADNPTASDFEIDLKICFAEEELRRISDRTKAALNVKKAELALQGLKLGNSQGFTIEARHRAIEKIKINASNNLNNVRAKGYIKVLRAQGKTFKAIASILNDEGFKTSRGLLFWPQQVKRLCEIRTA